MEMQEFYRGLSFDAHKHFGAHLEAAEHGPSLETSSTDPGNPASALPRPATFRVFAPAAAGVALVDGVMRDRELEPLRRGIELDDGPCQPARTRLLGEREATDVCPYGIPGGKTCVEVIIHEGRKNQVKRMLGKIGHPVLRLHRSTFGPLRLCDVDEGCWRYLSDDETAALLRAGSLEAPRHTV